jgi:hypothetical protein
MKDLGSRERASDELKGKDSGKQGGTLMIIEIKCGLQV